MATPQARPQVRCCATMVLSVANAIRTSALVSGRAVILAAALSGDATGQEPTAPGQPEQAATRIRELQTEADQLAAASGTLLTELRRLELARQIKSQEVRKADPSSASWRRRRRPSSSAWPAIATERAATTPLVAERLVEIYKRGRGGYLRLLLEADDLRQLGRLSRGVASVAQLDRVRFDAHRRTLRSEQEALESLAAPRARRRPPPGTPRRGRGSRSTQPLPRKTGASTRSISAAISPRSTSASCRRRSRGCRRGVEATSGSATSSSASRRSAARSSGLSTAGCSRASDAARRPSRRRGRPKWYRDRDHRGRSRSVRFTAARSRYAAPFAGFGTLVIVDHGANAFSLYGHLSQTLVTSRSDGRARMP